MDYLNWADSRNEICAAIEGRPSFFKILLKTKDDPSLLRRWIEHHAEIVGLENLIVFDNMSSDPAVLDIYREISRTCLVFRYGGFHNYIHIVDAFADLYRALYASCRFFTLIDTDERLSLISCGRHCRGKAITAFLEDNLHVDCIPAVWLNDHMRSETIFECGAGGRALDWGLKWGKPIVQTCSPLDGIAMHNVQLPSHFYSAETPANLFCLHLKNLHPEQRIRSNMQKLVARGFVAEIGDVDLALDKDRSAVEDAAIGMYVDEIRRLRLDEAVVDRLTRPGQMQFAAGGAVDYFDAADAAGVAEAIGPGSAAFIARNLSVRSLV